MVDVKTLRGDGGDVNSTGGRERFRVINTVKEVLLEGLVIRSKPRTDS